MVVVTTATLVPLETVLATFAWLIRQMPWWFRSQNSEAKFSQGGSNRSNRESCVERQRWLGVEDAAQDVPRVRWVGGRWTRVRAVTAVTVLGVYP
jgi:hypothetical protein